MTPEIRDKARRIADLAFGEADYGTVVDAIASAISSALPQPSGDVERMREALKPFAKLSALFLDPDNQATKGDDRPVWGYNSIDLTYGDFRRAASALAAIGGRDE